jgi:hypothetical protein
MTDVDDPTLHGKHSRPALLNLPSAHGTQPPVSADANCPAGHVFADNDPAGQENLASHCLHSVALSSAENVPAGQSEQVELSMALTFALKLPGGHGVGAPDPAGQKKPNGHTFIVDEFEPAGQKKPAEHGPLHVALIIAVTLPKKPARH